MRKNKQNTGEISLSSLNMYTYHNLCVAHARRIDNILSDELYYKATDAVIKLEMGGIMKGKPV